MVFSTLPDDPAIISAYGIYHPYRGGQNPNFDDFSAKILDVKNNRPPGFQHFLGALESVLADDEYTVVIVPSHDPDNTTSGIKALVKMLCQNSKRVDGTDCLVRHTKVDKSSTGGSRNIQKHIGSICVEHLNLITGKEVLLLDDVTTTHSSLLACQQILLQHNPKVVIAYALAQTA
jgi:predicted amidophosphoribosyltransferase